MEPEIQILQDFKMSSLMSLCKVKPPRDQYCSLVAETLESPTHIWPVFSWPLTASISYRVTEGLGMLIGRDPFLDFYMDLPSLQNEKGNWISLAVPFPSLPMNTSNLTASIMKNFATSKRTHRIGRFFLTFPKKYQTHLNLKAIHVGYTPYDCSFGFRG